MTDRREFLLKSAALAAAASLPVASAGETRMPCLFLGHAGPDMGKDKKRGAQYKAMGDLLPRKPNGIVAFTPHVREQEITIADLGIARRSFPRRFRRFAEGLRYHPPHAITLSSAVEYLLRRGPFDIDPQPHRGFNHTIWMPLIHIFPNGDIPLVEVSLPFANSSRLFELGRLLSPLRDEGILILSSGTLTHNLATLFEYDTTPNWAAEFDRWADETLRDGDVDSLINWRDRAPAAELAHPDDGAHFNVMLVAAGAAYESNNALAKVSTHHPGFELATFSTRDLLFR
ncbi:MAG: class III extradiol ring-cleavage dioxygenase [Pseudomonadota bacterium]